LEAPAETRDSYLKTYRKGWDKLRKERFEKQKRMGLVTDSWKFTDLSDVPVDRDDIAISMLENQTLTGRMFLKTVRKT